MKITICSDHGGYELKMKIIPFMEELGHEVADFGCYSETSVDYPDFAFPMAEAVARGEFTRHHNDSNVLAMGGRIIGVETAKAIVKTWLAEPFDGGRHEGRIAKISFYDKAR